jgi:hypothetical protein
MMQLFTKDLSPNFSSVKAISGKVGSFTVFKRVTTRVACMSKSLTVAAIWIMLHFGVQKHPYLHYNVA